MTIRADDVVRRVVSIGPRHGRANRDRRRSGSKAEIVDRDRVRFRTPSYVNLQSLGVCSKNVLVADLVAIVGSIDIVLGDVDR